MKNLKHSRLRNRILRDLYVSGKTLEEISKEFNTSPDEVQKRIEKLTYLEK